MNACGGTLRPSRRGCSSVKAVNRRRKDRFARHSVGDSQKSGLGRSSPRRAGLVQPTFNIVCLSSGNSRNTLSALPFHGTSRLVLTVKISSALACQNQRTIRCKTNEGRTSPCLRNLQRSCLWIALGILLSADYPAVSIYIHFPPCLLTSLWTCRSALLKLCSVSTSTSSGYR